MYAKFFGLKHEPFSIAPDPRYLFMSERHREALAHLLYGVGGGGGFVLLTGEIGAGKTTVCRCFLGQVPKHCKVAYVFNPKLTVTELLKTICDEFQVPLQPPAGRTLTIKEHLDPLNAFLLRAHADGQSCVLIIDEAQSLSAHVLEQLRLLTNLETDERKLLQIILIGQPELRDMLARPELEQLAQRVTARFHLGALSETETAHYIRHRMAVAGLGSALPFDQRAMQRVHQLARGVPRRINLVCDRALLGAYAHGRNQVDVATVEKAAGEVFGGMASRPAAPPRPALRWGLGLAGGAALVAAGWALNGSFGGAAAPAVASVAPARPASAVAAAASGTAASGAAAASVPAVATAPAASAPAPQWLSPTDLDALTEAAVRDGQLAWQALAPRWQLALGEGDTDPCTAAPRQQLQCYRGAATLGLIRQLDRPGVLTLYDSANQPVHALLTGLGERDARIELGGRALTVPLLSLASVWRGEFATFWRAPEGYTEGVVQSGPVADWLGGKLDALRAAAPEGADPPAVALDARVSAFQTAQGLKPDGRAGPITIMLLNRASGVDEPRLQTGK
jgi:general secretion pathway protein A